jgi:UPF0716 family protein affecting phage T7 exclusion
MIDSSAQVAAQQTSDTIAGALQVNVGTIMLAIQVATGFGNLLLIGLNLATVALGLFLMWPRIKKRWREIREGE